MASSKQVLARYASKVTTMVRKAGRAYEIEDGWEWNLEGIEGCDQLIESFHKEMRMTSDFIKIDQPDRLTRSDMLDDRISLLFHQIQCEVMSK